MPYDLTNQASYEEYFEALATAHKSIEGFFYGDDDVRGGQARNTWKGKRLWLWPYGAVKIEDNRSDNYLRQKEAYLFVGGAVGSAKFADEDAWHAACELIVEDIISRMLKDRAEGKLVTRLQGYAYKKSELNIGATKFLGSELRFSFYDPSGFLYDATRWD